MPEIKFFGVRQPVPGLPGSCTRRRRRSPTSSAIVGDGGLRVDLHRARLYPIPIAGLFTVTPFAGGRLTYYNQQAVGHAASPKTGVTVEDTVHDHRVRRQAEGGVEVETRASRVCTWTAGAASPRSST